MLICVLSQLKGRLPANQGIRHDQGMEHVNVSMARQLGQEGAPTSRDLPLIVNSESGFGVPGKPRDFVLFEPEERDLLAMQGGGTAVWLCFPPTKTSD